MTAPDLHALIADMGKAARAASARMAAAPSAARNLALQNPAAVAHIVRGWVNGQPA
jgi:glutamate-5-semialdehyde dehydrogenase